MTRPLVYMNARGESVMPLSAFKQLDPRAVMSSLIPCRQYRSRLVRRCSRGTAVRPVPFPAHRRLA